MPKHSGTPIDIGGRTLIMPALSMRLLKLHRATLSGMSAEPTDAEIDAAVGVIGDALRRNYPDITDEQLLDDIDLVSLPQALMAIAGRTGLEAVKPGEVGEGASTGAPSSDVSAQP